MIRISIFLSVHLLVATCAYQLSAQDSSKLAEVNGQSISLAVVHNVLDQSLGQEPDPPTWESRSSSVIRAGLEHCINREVILQHIQTGKLAIADDQAKRLVEEAKARIELKHSNFETFLELSKLQESEYRRELVWSKTWRRYARKHVTEEHLRKQFAKQKKTLDGTEIHVAQILWKQSDEATLATANQVHQQLVAKNIEWKTAVEEHSQSASAKNGGDLGWIKFNGPMPRNFTDVAFTLEPGEFAKPFASKFGVHIIHCVEVKAGTKTFEDVAIEFRQSETRRLFDLVAKRHRPNAKIEIFAAEFEEKQTDSIE